MVGGDAQAIAIAERARLNLNRCEFPASINGTAPDPKNGLGAVIERYNKNPQP